MYREKNLSLPQISQSTGIPISTVRLTLVRNGVELRARSHGVRLSSNRISEALTGKTRGIVTASTRAKLSAARLAHADAHAAGVSFKPNGYIEFTRGQHKGRAVHVVVMEEHIGRRIRVEECVHHIDFNKTNNDLSNLALMTREKHAALHRRLEVESGHIKERNSDGTFS
jgi:hypothetical protein